MGLRFAFVAEPPTRVGDLAAALSVRVADLIRDGGHSMGTIAAAPPTAPGAAGPAPLSGDVATLSGRYRWDIHHEHPVTSAGALADRQLTSYLVMFRRGRAACEAALRAQHGPPLANQRPGSRGLHQYGPFFVSVGDGDDFVLEWYDAEPDWAKPAVDAGARIQAVADIAAVLRGAGTEAAIAARAGDVGIRTIDRGLEFEPPMPATDFARALGVPDPVARTVGVHMSEWRIATVAGAGTADLRVGPWELEAYLDGPASGDAVPGVSIPAGVVRRLGERDVVRSVRIIAPPP